MLWYKAWLETRWRFAIGFVLLVCSAMFVVMAYPRVVGLIPLAPKTGGGGEIGRRIREAVELSRTYRGYVWSQWFNQNLIQTGTVFAILLGSGAPLAADRSILFTLSLPVSRGRLASVRAATGLAELFAIVFASSLVVPLMSPAVGERYSLASALVHGTCMFVASGLFFSLAFLISSIFNDIWRPLGIAVAVAVALNLLEQILRAQTRIGIFHLMSGEMYFRSGALPWLGLVSAALMSAAMLYGAAAILARRDY